VKLSLQFIVLLNRAIKAAFIVLLRQ